LKDFQVNITQFCHRTKQIDFKTMHPNLVFPFQFTFAPLYHGFWGLWILLITLSWYCW